jgi:hypothetical protein
MAFVAQPLLATGISGVCLGKSGMDDRHSGGNFCPHAGFCCLPDRFVIKTMAKDLISTTVA